LKAKQRALLLIFLFLAPITVHPQQYAARPQRGEGSGSPYSDTDTQEKLEKEMAKKAKQERQAALRNDTDKLLKLAGELKEYVNKSNENVLSLDVLRKADEIEKLAHSVKDKMRGPN
jgi:hypothetical protein